MVTIGIHNMKTTIWVILCLHILSSLKTTIAEPGPDPDLYIDIRQIIDSDSQENGPNKAAPTSADPTKAAPTAASTTKAAQTTAAPTTEELCANGEVVNSRCLTFHEAKLTWSEARDACAAVDGGQLVSLHNPGAVQNYITNNHPGVWYWTGASDAGNEGTWSRLDGTEFDPIQWADLSSTYDYYGINDYNGYPEYGNAAADCLMVSGGEDYEDDTDMTKNGYADEPCSHRMAYICEIATPLPSTAEDICAYSGGEYVAGQCLTFHMSYSAQLTWSAAAEYCAAVDGRRMASFMNTTAVYEYITATNYLGGWWYWTSGTDTATEGTWTWLDGSTFVPNPWAPENPDPWNPDNEDCLLVQGGDDDDDFGYADSQCSNEQAFICELDTTITI